MQYSQLIARIQADIYNNGAELITGDILQGDLLAIISALASAGAGYGGIITPGSSAPASLDQATFYLAIQPGTYSSFGVTVTEPSIVSYGGGSTLTFTVSPLGLAPAPTIVKLNTGDNPYVLVPLTGTDGMAFTVDIEGGYSGGDTEVYAQRWLVNYSVSHGVNIYVSGDKVSTDMIIWTKVYEDAGDLFLVLYANTGDLDYVTMAFRDMTGDPVPGITVEPNITGYVYSSDAVITNPEYQNNKVTFIDAASSNIQYPSARAVYDALITKQDVLVSGTNIKTINGNSILGAGDIVIEPGKEPNNEDITIDSNNRLKFADRPTAVNQMGYVILRKNKTFAEQVTQDNTIYEIRYDFDLNGGSVTIPAGCVLQFNGGSIINGTLDLNSDCLVTGQGIKCEITNPPANETRLSLYLGNTSDPQLNHSVLQEMIDSGVGIIVDTPNLTISDYLEVKTSLKIVGIVSRIPKLTFPNSKGFVWTTSGGSTYNRVENISVESDGNSFDFVNGESSQRPNNVYFSSFKGVRNFG